MPNHPDRVEYVLVDACGAELPARYPNQLATSFAARRERDDVAVVARWYEWREDVVVEAPGGVEVWPPSPPDPCERDEPEPV